MDNSLITKLIKKINFDLADKFELSKAKELSFVPVNMQKDVTTGEEVFRGVTPTGVTVDVFNYGEDINSSEYTLMFKDAYGDQQGSNYNAYTGGAYAYGGIVKSTLNEDGMPVLNVGKGEDLGYLFNATKENGEVITDVDRNAQYLFQAVSS